jgi:hypothetical protein
MAPKTSDANETNPRTKNQVAPSPSKKLRLQANTSNPKPSS